MRFLNIQFCIGFFTVLFWGMLSCGRTIAIAGGMEGGGGKGVQCGSNLRVLDLWEAENIHHLSLPAHYTDLKTNLSVYGTALAVYRSESFADSNDSWIQQQVSNFLKWQIVSRFTDIPQGNQLPFTPDATLPPIPSGCSFVQIAIYADDGRIYRDLLLWNQLSFQDQAALILHEGVYHRARLSGATTSDDTRFLIALTFAEKLSDPMLKPVWGKRKAWCGSSDQQAHYDFEVYAVDEIKNGQAGIGVYFGFFDRQYPIERLSSFVPRMSVNDLFFKQGQSSGQTPVEGSLFGDRWMMELQGNYQNGYGISLRVWKKGQLPSAGSWIPCQFQL